MQKAVQYISKCLCLMLPAVFLFGCNAPKNQLAQFNQQVDLGDLAGAEQFAAGKVHEKGNPGHEDLLWTLQLGSISRFQNNFDQSTHYFDTCENMIKFFDGENSEFGHTVGSVVVNDNVVPYTGQVYDGVMVNTYKAFNFMATGRNDLARVEFNRALDRQRRAKETFNREIQQLKEETAQSQNGAMVQQTMNNPEFQSRVNEVYSTAREFAVYPDFVNPFATYAAGIFFIIEKDFSRAIDMLKESAGMLPDNPYIAADFDAVEKYFSEGRPIQPTVWVFFENGQGPIKEENRLDLPLFIALNEVRYVGIALPQLVYRSAVQPFLDIQVGPQAYRTALLADMDSIIKTEFDKDFQGILTRAIITATAKAIGQYALEKNQDSSTAAVLAAIYSFATTAADVRIWTMLPKNIQIARFTMPEDGKITIQGPSTGAFSFTIPDCNHAVVYVKMIHGGVPPNIDIMMF